MLLTKVVEKNHNTHFVFSDYFFFFFENRAVYKKDNLGKYCRAGQAIDDNMAHAHCVLHT